MLDISKPEGVTDAQWVLILAADKALQCIRDPLQRLLGDDRSAQFRYLGSTDGGILSYRSSRDGQIINLDKHGGAYLHDAKTDSYQTIPAVDAVRSYTR